MNLLISGCVAQRADVIYKKKLEQRLAALPPPAVYQRQSSFQLDEYAPYRAKGTATLSGEAFLRTRGGDVRYAAGENVMLIPATAYSTEFLVFDLIQGKKEIVPVLDKRLYDEIRTAQADSKGRFSFTDIPDGAYILYTSIYWALPYASSSYLSTAGGPVWKHVSVKEGEHKTIVLTK